MAQGANEIIKQAAIVGLTAAITGNDEVKQFAVDAGFLVDAVQTVINEGDVDRAKRLLNGEESAADFVDNKLSEKYGNRTADEILRTEFGF